MFSNQSDDGYHQPLGRVLQKNLAFGDKTMMVEFRLERGAKLPLHSHPHEQTGYLVSGLLELTIGGETFRAFPGASWSISGEVEHSAIAREDSVAIEVFSPLREDYMAGTKNWVTPESIGSSPAGSEG